jgi:hypothetical protein
LAGKYLEVVVAPPLVALPAAEDDHLNAQLLAGPARARLPRTVVQEAPVLVSVIPAVVKLFVVGDGIHDVFDRRVTVFKPSDDVECLLFGGEKVVGRYLPRPNEPGNPGIANGGGKA